MRIRQQFMILMAAALIAGCGGGEKRAGGGGGSASDKSALVIAFDGSPTNLDPRVGTDTYSGRIWDMAASGLIKLTPNGDYAADAMVSWLAHALNAVVTNPTGDGWYDRYGLENSEKCELTYGTTYPVTNQNGQSALANIHLGQRHYLLQQNWVNGKKGHCAMSQ